MSLFSVVPGPGAEPVVGNAYNKSLPQGIETPWREAELARISHVTRSNLLWCSGKRMPTLLDFLQWRGAHHLLRQLCSICKQLQWFHTPFAGQAAVCVHPWCVLSLLSDT